MVHSHTCMLTLQVSRRPFPQHLGAQVRLSVKRTLSLAPQQPQSSARSGSRLQKACKLDFGCAPML